VAVRTLMEGTKAGGGEISARILLSLPSLLAGAGVLVAPLFVVRPNRIAQGSSLFVNALPVSVLPVLAFILLFCGLPLVFLIRKDITRIRSDSPQFPVQLRLNLFRVVSSLFMCSFLLFVCWFSRQVLTEMGSRARLSPGPGFWLVWAVWAYHAFLTRNGKGPIHLAGVIAPAILVIFLWLGGFASGFSLYEEWYSWKSRFSDELVNHLSLAIMPVIPAFALALPLAFAAKNRSGLEKPVFALITSLQIIPALALFGLLMPVLGVLSRSFPFLRSLGIGGLGFAPAATALFLYALLPLFRGCYLGLGSMDPAVLESARGMGMNPVQIVFRVQLPLALPLVVDGLRLALVQSLGLATLGALIGAGGLGWFVFQGLGQGADDLVILASLVICFLAAAADGLIRTTSRRLWMGWREISHD